MTKEVLKLFYNFQTKKLETTRGKIDGPKCKRLIAEGYERIKSIGTGAYGPVIEKYK